MIIATAEIISFYKTLSTVTALTATVSYLEKLEKNPLLEQEWKNHTQECQTTHSKAESGDKSVAGSQLQRSLRFFTCNCTTSPLQQQLESYTKVIA